MKKPIVSAAYLYDVYGSDEHLINCAYSGLFDAPLNDFYPVLESLDDTIGFGAASYKLRKFNHDSFANFVESKNIYEIFKKINKTPVYKYYKNIFQWMNSVKKLKNSADILKDKQLNPFRGQKNLEARLNLVNSKSIEELKQNLGKRTHRDIYPTPYDVYTELSRILKSYNQ